VSQCFFSAFLVDVEGDGTVRRERLGTCTIVTAGGGVEVYSAGRRERGTPYLKADFESELWETGKVLEAMSMFYRNEVNKTRGRGGRRRVMESDI
jgi:hypothetical protein